MRRMYISFLAYLRGIETINNDVKFTNFFVFLAYLRGIETLVCVVFI